MKPIFHSKVLAAARLNDILISNLLFPLFPHKLEMTDFTTSDNIPFDRFGWFYDRNGSESYDGVFEMFTGEDDIYKVSFSTFPFPICLCRSVKSVVGTRREASEIFILDLATDSRAALESSSLKIRWKSI